jgi:Ca2+-binding EF-hand superfamily protein
MNQEKIKEMLTIACPVPDGNIPISQRPQRDDLKELLKVLGFEFLIEGKLEDVRKELDPDGKGTVAIDFCAEWMAKQLNEHLNEQILVDAFSQFDSDKDGKINLEEFEFFMSGFAKDMNTLRDNAIVKDMMANSAKHAGEDKLFEITKLVAALRGVWQ